MKCFIIRITAIIILLLNGFHLLADEIENRAPESGTARINESVKKNNTTSGIYMSARLFTLFSASDIVGGGAQLDLLYRLPFFKNGTEIFRSSGIDLGIQEYITPAFNRISAIIGIEPVVFFDVKVRLGYDCIFDFLERNNADSDYDDETRNQIPDDTLHPKPGFRSDITSSFKYAIGPTAVMYSFTWTYHDYRCRGYYYDYSTFILHKGKDSFFHHDLRVLFKLADFRFGPQLTYSHVNSSGKDIMKAVFLAAYLPRWEFLDEATRPFFGIAVGLFLRDRYRQWEPEFSIGIGLTRSLF